MAPIDDNAPLPGSVFPSGTMSIADVYPTHSGIGGITTQDRALPAFADAMASRQATSVTRTGLDSEILGQPAGYLILAILGLLVGGWVIREVT